METSTVTTVEPSTTEETTVVSIVTTEASSSLSTTTVEATSTTEETESTSEQATSTTQDLTTIDVSTEIPENATTTKIERVVDPIIIPTVTYVNKTKHEDVKNDIGLLFPKISTELIVQKAAMMEMPKKELNKKKNYPRRKGTLKATYGDKHEKFYMKIKALKSTVPPTTTERMIEFSMGRTNNTSNGKLEEVVTVRKVARRPVVMEKAKEKSTTLSNEMIDHSVVANDTETNPTIETKLAVTPVKVLHNIITENPIKTEKHTASLYPDTSMPHTITTITNNNIQSIHYRTKKPKAVTQIKKPEVATTVNVTKHNQTEEIIPEVINKTKKKSVIPQKYNAKTMKSINKEIHKMPPTPISETSKTLSETVKSDIAPENKGGFEIPAKNNVWELLKEGSDNVPSKIDEKLHVQNTLSELGYNMSTNIDENRSL